MFLYQTCIYLTVICAHHIILVHIVYSCTSHVGTGRKEIICNDNPPFFYWTISFTNDLTIHPGFWPTYNDIAGPTYNNGSHGPQLKNSVRLLLLLLVLWGDDLLKILWLSKNEHHLCFPLITRDFFIKHSTAQRVKVTLPIAY